MASKPTIYKFRVNVSDLDHDYYDSLNLTVAQHPSETLERMMIRVMAFCVNAQESPAFTKGLSTPDEPDICARELNDQMKLWIDVGEPAFERVKKATRIASAVKVYSFNSKSDVWWERERKNFNRLSAQVFRFQWADAQALAALVERTMDFSITLSDSSAYVSAEKGSCELTIESLSTSRD